MPPRSERRLIATLAAHERWSRLDPAGRRQATAAARQANDDRWLKLAREQNPDADEGQLADIAANLRAAHFARMALKSAQARRKTKASA